MSDIKIFLSLFNSDKQEYRFFAWSLVLSITALIFSITIFILA